MTISPQLDLLAAMFSDVPASPGSATVDDEPGAAFTDVFDDLLSLHLSHPQSVRPEAVPTAKQERETESNAGIWNPVAAANPIVSVPPPVNQPPQLDVVTDAEPAGVLAEGNPEEHPQTAEQKTTVPIAPLLQRPKTLIRPETKEAGEPVVLAGSEPGTKVATPEPQLDAVALPIKPHPHRLRGSESRIEPSPGADEHADHDAAKLDTPMHPLLSQTDESLRTPVVPVNKRIREQGRSEKEELETPPATEGHSYPLRMDSLVPVTKRPVTDAAEQSNPDQPGPPPTQPSQHATLPEQARADRKAVSPDSGISRPQNSGFVIPIPPDSPQPVKEMPRQKTVEAEAESVTTEELPLIKAPARTGKQARRAAPSGTTSPAPSPTLAPVAQPAVLSSSESQEKTEEPARAVPHRNIAEPLMPAPSADYSPVELRAGRRTADYQNAFRARLIPVELEPSTHNKVEQLPVSRLRSVTLNDPPQSSERKVMSAPDRPAPAHQDPIAERPVVKARPSTEPRKPEQPEPVEPLSPFSPDDAPSPATFTAEPATSVIVEKPAEEPQPIHRVQQTPPNESPKAASAHDLKIDLSSGTGRVEVRLSERAGEVRVAVRTTDPKLAGELRQELPSLTARLEETGYRTEAWRPVADGPVARSIENAASSTNDSGGGTSGQEQGGQREHPDHRRPKEPEPQSNDNQERKEFQWFVSNPQDLPRF